MSQPHPRGNELLRKAIGRLVVGLEKREHLLRERRAHQRYSFQVKVHLCSKTSDNQYQTICEAWALDMSIGGMGCIAERNIETDDVIYVSFEEVLGHACYVPVQVKHSRTLIGNIRMLNAEFVFLEDHGTGQEVEQTDAA